MTISEQDLNAAFKTAFPDGIIEIKDLAGDDDHWQATITDAAFKGKNRLQQHRMVQEAVAAYDIHALAIKTQLPS